MIFEKLENADLLLFAKLNQYKWGNPIFAGILRGAMPRAKILAD